MLRNGHLQRDHKPSTHWYSGPVSSLPAGLAVLGLIAGAKCEVCGLDYSFADPADGPAFFSMTIVSFPALAFALWLQFTYEPPIWVHLLVTLPLTVGACVFLLRPLKGGWSARSIFTRRKRARLTTNGTPQKQNGVANRRRINPDSARTAGSSKSKRAG